MDIENNVAGEILEEGKRKNIGPQNKRDKNKCRGKEVQGALL